MKLLAKQINESDNANDAFCVTNAARPLLSFGPKNTKGNRRTYLYVEALRRFNQDLKKLNLTDVYKRAKPVYGGRMQHTFGVLKEEGPDTNIDLNIPSGANAEPVGPRNEG